MMVNTVKFSFTFNQHLPMKMTSLLRYREWGIGCPNHKFIHSIRVGRFLRFHALTTTTATTAILLRTLVHKVQFSWNVEYKVVVFSPKNLVVVELRLVLRSHSKNTWQSRGGQHNVTHTLFTIWNTVFSAVGGEQFCMTARIASLSYFLYNALNSSRQIRLKKLWSKTT